LRREVNRHHTVAGHKNRAKPRRATAAPLKNNPSRRRRAAQKEIMGCCNIQLFAVAASCFGIFTMIGLSEGAPRWSSAVHESNVATRLHHG
jgi:hypothetical protein